MNQYADKQARVRRFMMRLSVALVLFILANLVLIQQEYNRKYTIRVQTVQAQITKLANENKNLYISLENYYSFENLEKIAVDKLNMVYPEKVVFLRQQKD